VNLLPASQPVSRRTFIGGVSAAAASAAAQATPLPSAGLFSGTGRLRVGVIGCGGRGTGAAMQAATASPDVTITCLADLFADQLDTSAAVLAPAAGPQFDCPADRRFSGPDAWRHLLASDVDLVILAAPPATRPLHLTAAIRAGKHAYCEKPAAIDGRGLAEVIAACAEARSQRLSIGSGLCLRHDAATRTTMARLHDGELGSLRHIAIRSSIGLPWHKPRQSGWSHNEWRLRNWIAYPEFSGGHFVEHHIQALDKALWAFGDAVPVAAVPAAHPGQPESLGSGSTAVSFLFADGRSIDASIDRRPGNQSRIEETVRGTRGFMSLVSASEARLPCQGPHAVAMSALVTAILGGRRCDESAMLCRSTHAAVLGRMAADSGTLLGWNAVLGELA
jgi:predicted dehydrogenase